MVINELKNKLYENITKYGINSKKTYQASVELDKSIVDLYKSQKSIMYYFYEKSIEGLNNYIKKNKRYPSIEQWNKIAKQENYLSHESLQYISRTNFENLCKKVEDLKI